MSRASGHIILCGYTASTRAALSELDAQREEGGVTILSRHDVPQMDGVKHLALDYLNVHHLKDRRVALDSCSAVVVFAEPADPSDAARTVDMRTVLAVYNIRKERPDVPVIAEVVNRENTGFIDELGCSDVVYKETIDANLITSCILHPNISPIFYDLLTVRGKVLRTTTIDELGLPTGEAGVSYRDVRLKGIEQDVTYLGYIEPPATARLMPPNDEIIRPEHRLVFID